MKMIADWLSQVGMHEYAQCFAENGIDFDIVTDLTDQDLEKIGVTSLGHRRKLLRAIANLKAAEKVAPRRRLRLRHRPREPRIRPSAGKSP